jgi:hypothetical protein
MLTSFAGGSRRWDTSEIAAGEGGLAKKKKMRLRGLAYLQPF